MKRIISVILALTMVLSTFSLVTTASAIETVEGSFDYLANYIQENGEYQDDGDVTIYDFDYVVTEDANFHVVMTYSAQNDVLYFQFGHLTESSSIVTMRVGRDDYQYNSRFSFETDIWEDVATANINPQTYTNYTSLNYTFSSIFSNDYDYVKSSKELFDSMIHASVNVWNQWLIENVGINMGNFGFTQLFEPVVITSQVNTYTVTFNANGGSVSPSYIDVEEGGAITLPTPTRNGYTFLGWSSSKDSNSAEYYCGKQYSIYYNITLYAVWEKLEEVKNGLIKENGSWIYYNNSTVDYSFEGLVKNQYGWWYVKNGTIDTTYTGMAKNQYGWWYVKNGTIDTTYTGMAKNQYGWWYMKNGKLDKTYTGMAKNQYGWWYMKNGKLDKTYTGMAKNQYGWWYMKNGKLDKTYKGLAKNQYGWWYIQNGTINFKYNGTASNQYGTWKVVNGKVTTKA